MCRIVHVTVPPGIFYFTRWFVLVCDCSLETFAAKLAEMREILCQKEADAIWRLHRVSKTQNLPCKQKRLLKAVSWDLAGVVLKPQKGGVCRAWVAKIRVALGRHRVCWPEL